MRSTFIDTSYWIALVNPHDEFHAMALALAASRPGPFMTTQWVITELLDGYCGLETRRTAGRFVETLHKQESLAIVPASPQWFERGFERYRNRPDQSWSLTDCISFLVMEEWGLHEALTGDHHFEQAGFTALLRQGVP